MPNQRGIDDHTTNAEDLQARYRTIDRAAIYPPAFLDYVSETRVPLSILDVGSGAGNNAFFLATKGHHITAIEPSGLMKVAKRDHAHANITYVEDQLPALASQGDAKFDAILLDSVWHYIDPAERIASLTRLAQLLKPRGKLVVMYPTPPSRDYQFEVPPKTFLQDIATANRQLPKAQQLTIKEEPTFTQDMKKRKGFGAFEEEDVYYYKCYIESKGRAQSLPPREERKRS